MNLYLELDEYLSQWFVNDMGGNIPVELPRGSMESKFLEVFIDVPPENYEPDLPCQGRTAIKIPSFRFKDPRYYFYLSKKARDALVCMIRNRFDLVMWKELNSFSSLFSRKDALIYAFLEKHNIDPSEKNWNAVAKRLQRKRDYYLRVKRMKKK